MRRRLPGLAAVVGLAATFAVAWHLGLWLIVVTMASGAITLSARDRLDEDRVARRAAVWSLWAPTGRTDTTQLESVLAADLATIAMRDETLLDATIARIEVTIGDAWLRALATERLDRAKQSAPESSLAGAPAVSRVVARPTTAVAAGVLGLAVLLAAMATEHPWWLAPLPVATAVVATSEGEARRRRRLPQVLADHAAARPLSPGVIVVSETAVVAALTSLSGARRRALRRARSLVRSASGPEAALARERLSHAARGVAGSRRSILGQCVTWVVAAAAAVLVQGIA